MPLTLEQIAQLTREGHWSLPSGMEPIEEIDPDPESLQATVSEISRGLSAAQQQVLLRAMGSKSSAT